MIHRREPVHICQSDDRALLQRLRGTVASGRSCTRAIHAKPACAHTPRRPFDVEKNQGPKSSRKKNGANCLGNLLLWANNSPEQRGENLPDCNNVCISKYSMQKMHQTKTSQKCWLYANSFWNSQGLYTFMLKRTSPSPGNFFLLCRDIWFETRCMVWTIICTFL